MPDNVYKSIELTGSSANSPEEAVRQAIATAAQTIKHMRWFQVIDTRGHIENDHIVHWQVTVKVGFTIEGQSAS
jgi:flavin-binding protein dodecin